MTSQNGSLQLQGKVVAVVGGDEREQEIVRCALATGAEVRSCGFARSDETISGEVRCDSAEQAMKGAHYVLMPIPGMTPDGAIFGNQHIVPDAALLGLIAPGGHIILGKPDAGLTAAAEQTGITLHPYEHDNELMLLRAPAIVEGVLKLIIEATEFTIHRSKTVIVGQGNIGSVLTNTMVKLGARVTVAARNPVQRAGAETLGADTIALEGLEAAVADADIVISTVPFPLVTAAVIDRTPSHAIIVDMSAPPGGCALDHARETGRKAIWARALGRYAPVTVGRSQWVGIAKIIAEIEAKEAQA